MIGNVLADTVQIFRSSGAGFAAPITITGIGDPTAFAFADIDGQSDNVDVVVANAGGSVAVIIDGNQAAASFAAGTNSRSVAAGDLNHDGHVDLVVANAGSNDVSVLLGLGGGNADFAAATSFAAGSSPWSVALGDLDGDGDLDAVTANSGSNNVSILLGTGLGGFAAATNLLTGGSNPQSVAIGDFNNDAVLDLAVANFGSGDVSVLLGTGGGSFAAA